jgi:hypothetical protein
MLRIVIGVFLVLHGLVHLLYFGQSRRIFELQAGMTWPDGSWAFSGPLGDDATRSLASIIYALVAIGFGVGGIGLLLKMDWWLPATVASAAVSSVIIILLWNGAMQRLHDQGGIGLLINIAIVIAVLVLQWPSFSL